MRWLFKLQLQNAEGTGLDPFSCWLFLRGIKTLALRVARAQESASKAKLIVFYLAPVDTIVVYLLRLLLGLLSIHVLRSSTTSAWLPTPVVPPLVRQMWNGRSESGVCTSLNLEVPAVSCHSPPAV